jgi:diaminopimelate epimerase
MGALPFRKMHGLGNDFVVLDARERPIPITTERARALADRKFGIGCDQLISLEPSAKADAFMRIHNADGAEVEACGNATRCIARLLMAEQGRDRVVVETVVGLLDCRAAPNGQVAVDMGPARLDWRDIPLAKAMDTLHLDIAGDPVGVNVGNPHAVHFVADAEAVDVAGLGPRIEHHPLFPERINVEFATVLSPERIRMRVWERGVGITRACGTGACATLVAAARRGLTGRKAVVVLDGGELTIEWREDGHVVMTGPVAESFRGEVDPDLLVAP